MFSLFGHVALPMTPEKFDSLVDRICKKYHFTDREHAAAIISNAIRHIPNDKDTTTDKYLASSIRKNLANYVANYKANVGKHEAGVRQLVDMIKQDPTNQQAWDELQKAVNEGSDYAAKAIKSLNVTLDEHSKLKLVETTSEKPKQ